MSVIMKIGHLWNWGTWWPYQRFILEIIMLKADRQSKWITFLYSWTYFCVSRNGIWSVSVEIFAFSLFGDTQLECLHKRVGRKPTGICKFSVATSEWEDLKLCPRGQHGSLSTIGTTISRHASAAGLDQGALPLSPLTIQSFSGQPRETYSSHFSVESFWGPSQWCLGRLETSLGADQVTNEVSHPRSCTRGAMGQPHQRGSCCCHQAARLQPEGTHWLHDGAHPEQGHPARPRAWTRQWG